MGRCLDWRSCTASCDGPPPPNLARAARLRAAPGCGPEPAAPHTPARRAAARRACSAGCSPGGGAGRRRRAGAQAEGVVGVEVVVHAVVRLVADGVPLVVVGQVQRVVRVHDRLARQQPVVRLAQHALRARLGYVHQP